MPPRSLTGGSVTTSVLVCTRAGVVLHHRLFGAGGCEGDTRQVVSLRTALHTLAAPWLATAGEEEEHVALHQCVWRPPPNNG